MIAALSSESSKATNLNNINLNNINLNNINLNNINLNNINLNNINLNNVKASPQLIGLIVYDPPDLMRVGCTLIMSILLCKLANMAKIIPLNVHNYVVTQIYAII